MGGVAPEPALKCRLSIICHFRRTFSPENSCFLDSTVTRRAAGPLARQKNQDRLLLKERAPISGCPPMLVGELPTDTGLPVQPLGGSFKLIVQILLDERAGSRKSLGIHAMRRWLREAHYVMRVRRFFDKRHRGAQVRCPWLAPKASRHKPSVKACPDGYHWRAGGRRRGDGAKMAVRFCSVFLRRRES